MLSLRTALLLSAFCGIAGAAALVPIPGPDSPLAVGGLEANRGQANPEILLQDRLNGTAMTAQSILFSPLGVRMTFAGSNPNPTLSLDDPLPATVNSFSGTSTGAWVANIPRFGSARLSEVYPGIDMRYAVESGGRLTLRLLVQPGADPKTVTFDVDRAVSIENRDDGSLVVKFGVGRFDPALQFPPPAAFQQSAPGSPAPSAGFEVLSATRFRLDVQGRDNALALEVEMTLSTAAPLLLDNAVYARDTSGNTFLAVAVPDAPGKDAPFPGDRWAGCRNSFDSPLPCTDVAVFKISGSGELVFASYLAGRTREDVRFLRIAPDGTVMLAGNTDSSDFPVSLGALQPVYGGPPAPIPGRAPSEVSGDYFAARLDPETGMPLAATYLGGPSADEMGEAALGADGSLYFLHKWLQPPSTQMPASPGALLGECAEPCRHGYTAHLNPSLDRLLYGTYLPGGVSATAKLHSDGSVYYAGSAGEGFPTTPAAYQPRPASESDGIVARLDPEGKRLIFGTYIGGEKNDSILRMAVAPDGSVWVSVSSFIACCVDIDYRLVHLDAQGQRILADEPIDIGDIAVDPEGNLLATAAGDFAISPDAFLANPCVFADGFGLAYIKLAPGGELLFASYLPAGARYDFDGTSDRGLPILRVGAGRVEIIESQSMGVYAGCLVDAASFLNVDTLSPGAIVTLFGSRMGPEQGAGFELENGRVPTTLGGTRVLVNGEPAPILYASYSQVNLILPYSLQVYTWPKIQVESDGAIGNELALSLVQRAAIGLFRLGGSQAAALNEDYTVNSPQNPARHGSSVMLFGTGGGATLPRSTAGEVTPLEPRPLEFGAKVWITGGQALTTEYAGAAPGLVAGVTQINVRLPEEIPQIENYPPGVLPLTVETPGISYYPGVVTLAVGRKAEE